MLTIDSYRVASHLKPVLFLVDAILFCARLFFPKQKKPQLFRKVLFIRMEHIGDMVLATPCFSTWKKNYPACEVHVLCRDLTKELIQTHPCVDKVYCYNPPWFLRAAKNTQSAFSVIKQLRKEQYDAVFEMHGDVRSIIFARMIGSYVVGDASRAGRAFLDCVAPVRYNTHIIDQNLSFISPFCKKLFPATSLPQFNAVKPIVPTKKFVILAPLSGRTEKDLTDFQIKDVLKKHASSHIVLVGSLDQASVLERYANKRVSNLSGKTSLPELVELTRRASRVISCDTGIAHIARAVGTPVTVFFKSTDKRIWGEYSRKD